MGSSNWYDARSEIASFAYPLVNQLRIQHKGYPSTLPSNEAWEIVLFKIETALLLIKTDQTDGHEEQIHEGLKLFGEYFMHLWD